MEDEDEVEFATLKQSLIGKIPRYEGHLWREVRKILQLLGPPPAKRGRLGTTQDLMRSEDPAGKRVATHEATLRGMSEPRGIYR